MTTYLHIANGAFGLLVSIDRVMEVSDLAGQDATSASGLRCWRDRNLPVVNLGAQLGAPGTAARQQVVLRNDAHGEAAFALDVEQVMDLVDIDERRLQPVSEISVALARLVDAAWPTDAGRCLLRLRTPFAWSGDGRESITGALSP